MAVYAAQRLRYHPNEQLFSDWAKTKSYTYTNYCNANLNSESSFTSIEFKKLKQISRQKRMPIKIKNIEKLFKYRFVLSCRFSQFL